MNTIEGGAYQTVAGQWIDAEGKPLKKEQIRAAQQLIEERADANAVAEEAKMEQALRNDPLAQTLARQFGKAQEPKKSEKVEKPEKPASEPVI